MPKVRLILVLLGALALFATAEVSLCEMRLPDVIPELDNLQSQRWRSQDSSYVNNSALGWSVARKAEAAAILTSFFTLDGEFVLSNSTSMTVFAGHAQLNYGFNFLFNVNNGERRTFGTMKRTCSDVNNYRYTFDSWAVALPAPAPIINGTLVQAVNHLIATVREDYSREDIHAPFKVKRVHAEIIAEIPQSPINKKWDVISLGVDL